MSDCRYRFIFFPMCVDIKDIKDGKNALTGDLKWCSYELCPAEGGLLVNN